MPWVVRLSVWASHFTQSVSCVLWFPQEAVEEGESGRGISLWDSSNAAAGDFGAFGDAESKGFYEDLPGVYIEVYRQIEIKGSVFGSIIYQILFLRLWQQDIE